MKPRAPTPRAPTPRAPSPRLLGRLAGLVVAASSGGCSPLQDVVFESSAHPDAGAAVTGGESGASNGGSTTADGSTGDSGPAYMPAFIIGADISRVQEQEDNGVVFKDFDGSTPSGTTSTGAGLLTILKNHGFNYIRLRTFVNPAAPGGYSIKGYCDLAHTIEFGAGVKQAGMGFLLDFHYSDTWADPGHQAKPAAWANLSFAELTSQVYVYTKDVITQLAAGGARPDIVQIGNGIPSGLLWDDGRVSGQAFANLGALLAAGIKGVRDVDPNIKIMLHLDRCQDLASNTWWVNGVKGQGVTFDILGESCFDIVNYQQPATDWAPTLSSLASTYPDLELIVAEYSPDKQMVNDLVYGLPNKQGLGAFVWEPTNWGEQMFDARGIALSQYTSVYDNIAATYGQR